MIHYRCKGVCNIMQFLYSDDDCSFIRPSAIMAVRTEKEEDADGYDVVLTLSNQDDYVWQQGLTEHRARKLTHAFVGWLLDNLDNSIPIVCLPRIRDNDESDESVMQ